MGKYNPEEVAQLEKEKAEAEQMEKEAASKITVADRCEVSVPGQVTRRGNIFTLYLMPCPFTGPKMFWAGPNFFGPVGCLSSAFLN